MVGKATRVCLKSGEWSGTAPECKRLVCGAPSSPRHSHNVSRSSYSSFENVTFTCLPGYKSLQDMTVTCQENGRWTHLRGTCVESKRKCSHPPLNTGAILLGSSHYIGDKVVVSCPSASKALKKILICTDGGVWSGQASCIAHCKPKCQNGGLCTHKNRCFCPPGFYGQFCEKARCILPCLNGGTCVHPFLCSCQPGYSGMRCQTARF